MFSGRNIPRKSATGAFLRGADEIVRATELKTKALKAARARDSAHDAHSHPEKVIREGDKK